MQMRQPTQMASDHDMMITHTHTYLEEQANTQTMMSFFLCLVKESQHGDQRDIRNEDRI